MKKMNTKIGFIGTGVMGSSMVKHLMAKGYELFVYNRTKSKAQPLIDLGAHWCGSPAQMAENCQTILTIVGYPKDVEEVYFGKEGIFSKVQAGSTLIDLTTSTPSLAALIYQKAKELSCNSLDAPVSGGDLGAKNATLTTMVGGDEEVFKNSLPILESFSKKVILQGAAGAGQHTKMANQIMIAGTMTGMTELLVYAKAANLDLERVIETVGGGSAANWSLANYAPRILREDYSPGFFAKHFLKDLSIALAEAEKMDIFLPATLQAKKLYETLCDDGFGDEGTQALIKLYWTEEQK